MGQSLWMRLAGQRTEGDMARRLPLAHDLCCRLQNGSRSRLYQIALPSTSQFARILSVLLGHGFVSSVTRGTSDGPDANAFLTAPLPDRRLWVALKYRDEQPVLRSARPVSKPSLRLQFSRPELQAWHAGKTVRNQRALITGEICIVRDDQGDVMEGREAIRLGAPSSEVLCRVSS